MAELILFTGKLLILIGALQMAYAAFQYNTFSGLLFLMFPLYPFYFVIAHHDEASTGFNKVLLGLAILLLLFWSQNQLCFP